MATDDTKIGFDPLAWMSDDEDEGSASQNDVTSVNESSIREEQAGDIEESPLGLNVKLLEDSFALLKPQGEELVKRFYNKLFAEFPSVKPLFVNTTQEAQQKKLLAALQLVVNNLRKPEVLAKALQEMGARHQGYKVLPEHFPIVANTLLSVMSDLVEDAWTNELKQAWTDALNVVADVMLAAYTDDLETEKMSNTLDKMITSALEGSTVAFQICDADLNIVYNNPAVIQLLKNRETELQKVFPNFDANNMVGQNIDQFHKNPAHQRALLKDPNRLPFRAEMSLLDIVFDLNSSMITDGNGNYIGNLVEWKDVTEQSRQEKQVASLQSAIEGSNSNLMMCDEDLNITYLNPAVTDFFSQRQHELKKIWPGFDASNLVGQNIDQFHKNPAHQRALLKNIAGLPAKGTIDLSHIGIMFEVNATAILDSSGGYMGNMVEWKDVTEQLRQEKEIARLSSAIEGANSNLMMCDDDLTITYLNPAVLNFFRERQAELRRIFPSFNADTLVGTNIDQFHRNPAHQRALLGDVNRLPAKGHINLEQIGIEFEVNATAILDAQGKYMGNMVEWKDITEQMDAERQINTLVDGAVAGELDQRIDTSKYEGFMAGLGNGINEMLEAVVMPLRESARVVQALSEGDLTTKMIGDYQGEFGTLRDSVNSSVDNLFNMVTDILEATTNIATASSEIAQGNTDLSQRTEQQASSLEETASSMEELTSTVKQNADNSRQANQLSAGAREKAEKGGAVVNRAISAMSEINSSSKKIADIISVIDEIAFQTNLLALNAAVEAARAGEQGRGFAVVAGEVRNLAQRSAGAAKEIKGLIQDSVGKVEEGSKLVDESGKTLDEIVNEVKKVSDIIAEISAASQEQASGIDQVNKAVMSMDEVTQQNAALVEEAASASESLDEQARTMEELVSFFNIGEDQSKSSRGRSRQPAQAPARESRPAPARRAAPASRRSTARPVRSSDDNDNEWEEF